MKVKVKMNDMRLLKLNDMRLLKLFNRIYLYKIIWVIWIYI
jgi:hypothetical protein